MFETESYHNYKENNNTTSSNQIFLKESYNLIFYITIILTILISTQFFILAYYIYRICNKYDLNPINRIKRKRGITVELGTILNEEKKSDEY